MHFDSKKDDILIFIYPRREIRSLKEPRVISMYIGNRRSETQPSAEAWDTRSTGRRSQGALSAAPDE